MKKKKRMIAVICVVCILLAVPAGYMIRTRGSVHVKSQSDYTAEKTVYFLQKDPQWGDEKLGSSSYTMAGSGCLTICIASALQRTRGRFICLTLTSAQFFVEYYSRYHQRKIGIDGDIYVKYH